MANPVPTILNDDRRILAIHSIYADDNSIREGVYGVTAIEPYVDNGALWLAVYVNGQLNIRLPANSVSVHYT